MTVRTLAHRPAHSPRRKFRGKASYFRRLRRDAEAFELAVHEQLWWSLWHHHVDWRGWGNRGWQYRREHLHALCTIFGKIADLGSQIATPFQAWILIHGEDASQDAVYLHTPNPHTPFPMLPPTLEWGTSALCGPVREFLPSLDTYVGWSTIGKDDGTAHATHWIWARGVGDVPAGGRPQ